MANIEYKTKEELGPKFGRAIKPDTIHIREDLPGIVKSFIEYHELYHLGDNSTNVFWREVKANIYGASKRPVGFICTVIMSLTPTRIKFYIERFKKGE